MFSSNFTTLGSSESNSRNPTFSVRQASRRPSPSLISHLAPEKLCRPFPLASFSSLVANSTSEESNQKILSSTFPNTPPNLGSLSLGYAGFSLELMSAHPVRRLQSQAREENNYGTHIENSKPRLLPDLVKEVQSFIFQKTPSLPLKVDGISPEVFQTFEMQVKENPSDFPSWGGLGESCLTGDLNKP